MTIKITYNNIACGKHITCAWGMGCIVEGLEKTILFDTGGNGKILLSNMKQIGIDPQSVKVVVLSHIHGDHTGGLFTFLEINSDVIVYLPESFPGNVKQRVKDSDARCIEVAGPVEIFSDAFSTGEMGTSIREQALIIKTVNGLVIITGCSHPGIVPIARKAVQVCHDRIFFITGGFHLGGASHEAINYIIRELKALGVEKIGSSHCTGDSAIRSFRATWGSDFIEAGCGAIIKISYSQ